MIGRPFTNGLTIALHRRLIKQVSKDEYDNCRLNAQSQARIVAVCDQREQGKMRPPVTVTFRSFTPQPNGLEFTAGQDYYFISALLGAQNDPQRRFSPCREQNMKVIFKVCCKSGAAPPTQASAAQAVAAAITGRPAAAGQQQQPTFKPANARPPATFKPSLAPAPSPNRHRPLQEYLSTLAPVTVLPIEVLSASSEASAPAASENSIPNDIFQNEQAPASSPQPQPQPIPHPAPPPPQQPYQRPVLIPFNPAAGPDVMVRWAPTPLPAEVLRGNRQPGWAVQRAPQQEPWQAASYARPPARSQSYKDPRESGRHPLYPSNPSIYSTCK